jgi:hypothetical protein
MNNNTDISMESSLINLVNYHLDKSDIYLDRYQRIDVYIYNKNILDSIIKTFKFKDIGNVYDYPDFLPQPDCINVYDFPGDYKLFKRIATSKKYNSILSYNGNAFSIFCTILVDIEYIEKFQKKIKNILKKDTGSNLFLNVNFDCKPKEYIEVSDITRDKTKPIDILRKEVPDENLIFDENSTLNEVMNDISLFFKKEAFKLYNKLQLPYKRGIILYGDPGNGKTAMVRQIIRIVPSVSKILISPNVNNVTRILSSLTKALDGKQAIIVIEDIDSLINEYNRSEFLNILDGVEIKSGIYFIGTTNYPDRIDPAFMNRSGRFDRTYKIDNPNETTRKLFFESRKIHELLSEYKVYKDDDKPDNKQGVIDLFVKNSENLPMANLKELITSVSYLLAASNNNMSIEEAVSKSYNSLIRSRSEHMESVMNYNNQLRMNSNMMRGNRRPIPPYPNRINSIYNDDDDD